MRLRTTVIQCVLLLGFAREISGVFEQLSAMFASREPKRCPSTDIRCVDGRCILKKWRCDGQTDCRDGSDEENCPALTCSQHQHHCGERKCIPVEWRCDGKKDCDDGSDELDANCDKECPTQEFWKCGSSRMCIPRHWKCDGEKDCRDGEDEDKETCSTTTTCYPGEHMCADRQQCVQERLWCDGHPDCKDKSDESGRDCLPKPTTELPPCHKGEFRCPTGRCIPGFWVCDGGNDCDDGEDERTADCVKNDDPKTGGGYMSAFYALEAIASDSEAAVWPSSSKSTPKCKTGDFSCRDGECIPEIWRCDGSEDCLDGSDEAQSTCASAVATTHAVTLSPLPTLPRTCPSSHFPCVVFNGTKGICLPIARWCDSHIDCANETDEGFGCLAACKENGQCSHQCHPTPSGPKCSCNKGFVLSSDGKACSDVDECKQGSPGGPCSQGCVNTKGSYKCECGEGFAIAKDGHTCKAKDPAPLIYYAADGQIRSVTPEGKVHHEGIVESEITKMTVGLDWSSSGKHRTIYFSDMEHGRIYWLNTSSHQSGVVVDGVKSPESIAYDWTSNNLYYVNSDKPEIGVCRVREVGSYCAPVIQVDLARLRGIAVHPGKRMMFFSKWGVGAKIERAWLDGSARQDLVTTKVVWPNALTVDYIWERLYFFDAKVDWLESVDLHGGDRRVVLHTRSHPFDLTILGNRLYWTDWNMKAVNSVLTTGLEHDLVESTIRSKPMGIVAVHPSRQPKFETPCSANKSPCDHICLARPGDLHFCLCHTGYHLVDEGKCVMYGEHVQQELRSSDIRYSASSVVGIICACVLCLTVLIAVVAYARKYLLTLKDSADEKSLLDYDSTDSPRKKADFHSPSSIGTGSPNPCYENYPPPSYVVKFHKYQLPGSPDTPASHTIS